MEKGYGERGYHAGQPSVLDDSDSHLPAEEELKGLDKMNSKDTLKLHGLMFYELTCIKQFLYFC